MRRLLPILIAGTLLGALLPAVAAADATVNVPPNNVIFDPAGVTIPKGQSVNWNFSTANLDHNILFFAKDAPFPTTNPGPSGAAFTFTVGGPASFQKTFTEAGLFRYVCTLHFASMRGTVTVTDPPPPPPPPPPGTQPLPPEPIALASDIGGPTSVDLFTLNGSESGFKQLTTDGAENLEPAWSYDAANRQIAYQSARAGRFSIFRIDADGTDDVNLTPDNTSNNLEPSWSPDSFKIAFSSDRTGNGDIYVMDFDGSNVRRLTSDAAGERHPTWSPDGRQIAFASDKTGKSRLMIMDVDPDGSGEGTNARALGPDFETGAQTEPDWSPVDDKIAYTQLRGTPPDPDPEVFDIGANTFTPLTGSTASDLAPTWAPDGSRVIWTRLENGHQDLFIRATDASGTADAITKLDDTRSYATPAWQPAPKPARTRPTPPPPATGGDPGTTPGTTVPAGDTGGTGGATPPPADPGTAIRPSAFLALDVPHRTKVDAFRKLGLPVEARCTNLVKGTARLTVSRKVARSLGLRGTKLASATATCGADRRAAVLLKPGKQVKRALATPRARAAVRRARGLKATLTVFFEGGDSTLTDKLAITLAR
ncbi:MAG TPA: plastocyanin/azurin family copper-binding protein [Solirubrobacteraceae bacterium]|nr:plastocyanin/azurin family copper-binding protein [Solirubrobacteraceae bacterium]